MINIFLVVRNIKYINMLDIFGWSIWFIIKNKVNKIFI